MTNSSDLNVSHFSKALSRILKTPGLPGLHCLLQFTFPCFSGKVELLGKSRREDKVTPSDSVAPIMCLRHTKCWQPIKTLQGQYDDLSITDDRSEDQRGSETHPGSHSSNAESKPK